MAPACWGSYLPHTTRLGVTQSLPDQQLAVLASGAAAHIHIRFFLFFFSSSAFCVYALALSCFLI